MSRSPTEVLPRRALLGYVVVALSVGLLTWNANAAGLQGQSSAIIWTAGTVPVIAVSLLSLRLQWLTERARINAISVISMTGALIVGEALAAIIVALAYALGTVVNELALAHGTKDLHWLRSRFPHTAHLCFGGRIDTVSACQVGVGHKLLVRQGEVIPVDGELLEAYAQIDMFDLTRETGTATRYAGQRLQSGTINAGAPFSMRATATAENSSYVRIMRLAVSSHKTRAPFTRRVDRSTLLLLPMTLVLAGGVWWWTQDPLRGLVVTFIAASCPLVLASQVAFVGGVSRAARVGIFFKGSPVIEALAKVRTVVFNKIGTLTAGGNELLQVEYANGFDEEVITLAASLEVGCYDVVASAIIEIAGAKGLALYTPENVRVTSGAGLSGVVLQRQVRVGSKEYILDKQESPAWCSVGEDRFRGEPVMRVYTEVDGRIAAVFTFNDAVRIDANMTIEQLRALGMSRIVLLTGDSREAASRLAALIPFDRVIPRASREKKLAIVEEELNRQPTMIVGGVDNFGPAVVRLSAGPARAPVVFNTADIVILSTRLAAISQAVHISKSTRRIALQSVAAGVMLSGVGIAGAVLGYLTPLQGALFQGCVNIAVVGYATRASYGST